MFRKGDVGEGVFEENIVKRGRIRTKNITVRV